VRRWRASGLSARAFASREQLNPGTLLWWSSKLGRDDRAAAAFIEVRPPPSAPSEPGCIDIVLRDEVRIRVSGAFDAALLRRVVAALEAR
jgi:hypothetical protein